MMHQTRWRSRFAVLFIGGAGLAGCGLKLDDDAEGACVQVGTLDVESKSGKLTPQGDDTYRFELDDNGRLNAIASQFTARPNLYLYQASGDAGCDRGKLVTDNIVSGSAEMALAMPPGAYVLRLQGETDYDLGLSFERHPVAGPAEDPGPKPDSSAASLDLSSPQTLGGYVGVIDKLDVYSFEVSEPGKLTVIIQDFKARPNIHVYRVVADDGAFSTDNEQVGSNIISGSAELNVDLEPGPHHLKIEGETTYTLSASFQPK